MTTEGENNFDLTDFADDPDPDVAAKLSEILSDHPLFGDGVLGETQKTMSRLANGTSSAFLPDHGITSLAGALYCVSFTASWSIWWSCSYSLAVIAELLESFEHRSALQIQCLVALFGLFVSGWIVASSKRFEKAKANCDFIEAMKNVVLGALAGIPASLVLELVMPNQSLFHIVIACIACSGIALTMSWSGAYESVPIRRQIVQRIGLRAFMGRIVISTALCAFSIFWIANFTLNVNERFIIVAIVIGLAAGIELSGSIVPRGFHDIAIDCISICFGFTILLSHWLIMLFPEESMDTGSCAVVFLIAIVWAISRARKRKSEWILDVREKLVITARILAVWTTAIVIVDVTGYWIMVKCGISDLWCVPITFVVAATLYDKFWAHYFENNAVLIPWESFSYSQIPIIGWYIRTATHAITAVRRLAQFSVKQ